MLRFSRCTLHTTAVRGSVEKRRGAEENLQRNAARWVLVSMARPALLSAPPSSTLWTRGHQKNAQACTQEPHAIRKQARVRRLPFSPGRAQAGPGTGRSGLCCRRGRPPEAGEKRKEMTGLSSRAGDGVDLECVHPKVHVCSILRG